MLLNKSPKNIFDIFPIDLHNKTFILIDEIQYLNNPTNFLKYLYDSHAGKIKIIASGSSAFYIDKKFKDSLVGRKIILPVRTLSFHEFLRFKEQQALISILPDNFTSTNYHYSAKIALQQKELLRTLFNEFVQFGGYPKVVLAPLSDKTMLLEEIAYSYIKKDVYEANIRQDDIFYRLFKMLASQIGQLININELSHTLGISRTAIDNYLYVMRKSFHIILIRPFYRNARKEITRMPKLYFLDIGLRNFFANNFESMSLRNDRGQLLENAVIRQLIERTGLHPEEKIKFWRSKLGAEIDIIYDENIAFEIKFEPHLYKSSKYRSFSACYPDMPIHLISYSSISSSIPLWEPWLL